VDAGALSRAREPEAAAFLQMTLAVRRRSAGPPVPPWSADRPHHSLDVTGLVQVWIGAVTPPGRHGLAEVLRKGGVATGDPRILGATALVSVSSW